MVMAFASFYVLYCGITNTFNIFLWMSIILLLTETVILLFNGWACPLTHVAEKHTANRKDNFDIYLPNWLAKYNKLIFGTVFTIGLILVIINYIRNI